MSRLGKQPIKIPQGTTVDFTDGVLTVKGPKGELKRNLKDGINISIAEGVITTEPTDKGDNFLNALWGTYVSHIKNMIEGVNKLYEKKLIIEGVGYKALLAGDKITMSLGFSHPVIVSIPKDLTVEADKNSITIKGIDKEAVGQFAAEVRANKKPEPYKGKGIRYNGEVIRRKQGKKAA